MDFLRNVFGKKQSTKPLSEDEQDLAYALALTAVLDQTRETVARAMSNRDFQTTIKESTIGIEFANKKPELIPDCALQLLYLYSMRAAANWALDKNRLALSDIEIALNLPMQNFLNEPLTEKLGTKLLQMQDQILTANKN